MLFCICHPSLDDLDREVLDQFDERIFLPLPDASCREELILLFWRKFVERNNATAYSIKSRLIQFFTRQAPVFLSVEDDIMAGEQLEEVVAATRGFSGDEIGDMVFSLQSVLHDAAEDGRLDFVTAWKLIEAKVKHHRDSQEMAGEHTLSYLDGDIDLQDVTFV